MKDKPIYPESVSTASYSEMRSRNEGMTLREYYAGLAMQGWIASGRSVFPDDPEWAKTFTDSADALIAELQKEQE